jgi:hypothetical protein
MSEIPLLHFTFNILHFTFSQPQRHEGTKFHKLVSRKEAKAQKCCFHFPLREIEEAATNSRIILPQRMKTLEVTLRKFKRIKHIMGGISHFLISYFYFLIIYFFAKKAQSFKNFFHTKLAKRQRRCYRKSMIEKKMNNISLQVFPLFRRLPHS